MVLKLFANIFLLLTFYTITALQYKFYENDVDFGNGTKIVAIIKQITIVFGNKKLSVFQIKSNQMTKVWEIMVDDNSIWTKLWYNKIFIICVTIKNEKSAYVIYNKDTKLHILKNTYERFFEIKYILKNKKWQLFSSNSTLYSTNNNKIVQPLAKKFQNISFISFFEHTYDDIYIIDRKTIYAYNLKTKRMTVLASNVIDYMVRKIMFISIKEGKYVSNKPNKIEKFFIPEIDKSNLIHSDRTNIYEA
ncbi:hypothetical protein A3Q56_06706, partial [Intoshia linei]